MRILIATPRPEHNQLSEKSDEAAKNRAPEYDPMKEEIKPTMQSKSEKLENDPMINGITVIKDEMNNGATGIVI